MGCDIGNVLDMSIGGLRVTATRRLAGRHRIQLSHEQERVTVWVQVRWSHRVGLLRYEAGLQFVGLQPAQQSVLQRVPAAL